MPLNLEPGATLRQYRIVRLLGRGGMGEVYAADDTKLGRKVAIKILPATLAHDAERLRRFTQEAKAASALNHPSILTIYDVDEDDGHPFLVTEFIDGQTLRERIRLGGLTLRESLEIAGQIANALGTAHAAGIVHRDVKPENIMLREDGHAKLVDFGLAKMAADATATNADETVVAVSPQTTPGLVMGTTQYMSPEQARGLKVDARSDIFSLGVVLYEMAAGRPPFGGDTPSDVIAAILHFDPPAIADAPPELEHILHRALEKDRDERHQTAKDLAADLRRLRRRLDPAGDQSRSSTGQGATTWASTPQSGNAAAAVLEPPAATTPAPVASRTMSTVSKVVWLFVASMAALTIIGFLAMAGLIGLAKWVGDTDNDADERPGIEDFSVENMTIEKVSGLGQVATPTISDDGRLLAYRVRESGQNSIWLRQMATGSVLRIAGPTANDIERLLFTPDGNFLYYIERSRQPTVKTSLMMIPALGGTSREVLEAPLGWICFAPDGRRFAAVRFAGTAMELLVANTDGSGASVIATHGYGPVAWSPSGEHLAVAAGERVSTGMRAVIQVMKPDGSEPRVIVPSGPPLRQVLALVWGADGNSLIASVMSASIFSPSQLVLIRASDGRVTRITNDVNDYPHATFSPATGTIVTLQRERLGSLWIGSADRPEDAKELPSRLGENDGRGGLAWLNNRQLVFVRETDVPSLWMVNDDGTNVRRLTENESSINPVASRDGNVVLFESDRAVRGVSEAYSLGVSDRRVTQITKESGAAGGTLSPDGRSVFFVASTSSPYKLLRMPFSGGPTATLFEGHLLHEPRMSPDGRWVAVMGSRSVNEPRSVMIVPADGGPPRTIYKSTAPHQHVQWYPSSDALLLMHNEGGQSNIFKLDIAGGPPRQLTRFTRGTLDSPAISPDGRRIAFYRGTDESDIVLLKPRATE